MKRAIFPALMTTLVSIDNEKLLVAHNTGFTILQLPRDDELRFSGNSGFQHVTLYLKRIKDSYHLCSKN